MSRTRERRLVDKKCTSWLSGTIDIFFTSMLRCSFLGMGLFCIGKRLGLRGLRTEGCRYSTTYNANTSTMHRSSLGMKRNDARRAWQGEPKGTVVADEAIWLTSHDVKSGAC